MTKPCRYCKSPAVKRPCWWYLDHPSDGGDPPCECDAYYDEIEEKKMNGVIATAICAVLILAAGAGLGWYGEDVQRGFAAFFGLRTL